MNADLESDANNDLKKKTSCISGKTKMVLLIVSALLTGMIIATVVIFTTGLDGE